MGQYWEVVNIDKWAVLSRYNAMEGIKLPALFEDRSMEQMLGMLLQYKWVPFKASQEKIRSSKSSSSSPLMKLPQEIIDVIVAILTADRFDDDLTQSATCLALSCTYFFRLMAPHLQKFITSGPWAGDRLIFVGDYARGYPTGIASKEEEKEWADVPDGHNENPLYLVTNEQYFGGGKLATEEQEMDFKPMRVVSPQKLVDDEDQRLCDVLVEMITKKPKPVDEALAKPILRNLTAKKYVKDQDIAESVPDFCLGDVILVLGIWTEDPSGTAGLGIAGEWAGHRFDIATMADVDEDWEDAGELALSKLTMLIDSDQMYWDSPREPGRRAV